MKTIPFTLTTRDGLLLPGQAWLPAKPHAFIAVVHGLSEHSGRYERFAMAATKRGLGVLAMDLRGHGRSPGDEAFVGHFSEFLLDVDALMVKARALAGPLPIVLMGHSMGGAISMRWVAERQPSAETLTGLVLSSAALKIGKDISKLLQLLAPVISQLAPRIRLTALPPESISRDPAEVERYISDPLNGHKPVPARTGSEILHAITANHIAAGVITQPVYIFHGGKDTLTDPDGSRDIYQAWGGNDKTLRIWPESVHETLNDYGREDVMRELFDWIDSKTATKTKTSKPTSARKVTKKAAA